MIDELMAELARELRAAGVHGRAARRVESEARDHLLSSAATRGPEQAVASFGDPRDVASGIAAQLATTRTRWSALAALAALTVSGVAYLVASALVAGSGWPDITAGQIVWIGVVATIGLALVPQVAFACGLLTLLSLLARRRATVLGDTSLRLLRRRALVGMGAAAATSLLWLVWATQFDHSLPTGSPPTLAVALVSAAALPGLAVAALLVARATRPAATPDGGAATALEELDGLATGFGLRAGSISRLTPWRFALSIAALVFLAALVLGWIAEGDAGSGLARAVPETAALLACFAVLRRPLALAGA